jgi:hypothetical protein
MSCCGQKRLQWQQKTTHQQYESVSPELVLENPVPISYHGTNTCLIRGTKTGYLYLFSAHEPGLMIDERDVPQLLAESQKFSLAEETILEKSNAHLQTPTNEKTGISRKSNHKE